MRVSTILAKLLTLQVPFCTKWDLVLKLKALAECMSFHFGRVIKGR